MLYLSTKALVTWADSLTLQLPIPFFAGPYQPEFGNGDMLGLVQQIPGAGQLREGTFEQLSVLFTLRARDVDESDLEMSMGQLDTALQNVSNQVMWGNYVTYVDRLGTVFPSYDEPQRISLFANYVIEMGA